MKYKGTYDIYRLVRHRFAWIVREIHVGRHTGFRHTPDRGEKPERRGGWMDIERISNVRKCNRRNVFRHGQIYNLCNRDLLTYLLVVRNVWKQETFEGINTS